jgi:glycosyltransferase involved in cell wall biosynthesis
MHGHIDVVTRERIEGWAWDADTPNDAIIIRVYDNGIPIGDILADRFREDLQRIGLGNGRHAFEWVIPGGLSPKISHTIEVRRLSDGLKLDGLAETLPADPIAAGIVLEGSLDSCGRNLISGWALDSAQPDRRVPLQILNHDTVIERTLANRYRKDLEQAGLGDGRCAFEVRIPGGLTPFERHIIHVQHEEDGRELPGSPVVIDASHGFDEVLETAVARAVETLAVARDQDRALLFFASQTERLLQKRGEIDAQRHARLAHREFRRGTSATARLFPHPGLRALVIDEVLPNTARDAGSQAIVSHMQALQKLNFTVSFVAAQMEEVDRPLITGLETAGISYYGLPYYASVEDILKRQRDCFDLIYIHRLSNAEKYLALARHYNHRARLIYSVADLHHIRVARQAEIEKRPELLPLSKRMRLGECSAAVQANAVLTHSVEEARWLRQAVPSASVHVAPWTIPLHALTTQADTRHGVAFLAGFQHRPNLDAAWFLVAKVMPLVWRRNPEISCLLAGSFMPDAIRKLAEPRVEILGAVDDLAEVFGRVRLTVAPLRYGAGVKGKVLNSLAAGIPCVMSPIAAEGIPFGDEFKTLIGKTAEELAILIVDFHDDLDALARFSKLSQDFIEEQYSETATVNALKAAVGEL